MHWGQEHCTAVSQAGTALTDVLRGLGKDLGRRSCILFSTKLSGDGGAEINGKIFPSDHGGTVGPIPLSRVSSSQGIKHSPTRSMSSVSDWRPAMFPNDLKCPGINSVVFQLISNDGISFWIIILLWGKTFPLLVSQNFTTLCSEESFQERNL